MTLVKLDNGDYINTAYVVRIHTISTEIGLWLNDGTQDWDEQEGTITPNDRDRIVEAMTNQLPAPYEWETKEGTVLTSIEQVRDYEKTYNATAWPLWDQDALAPLGLEYREARDD